VTRAAPVRVLLVDDEEMNCDMLSRRLTRQGYETVVARSGAEALERLAERSFHLVLLDVRMPGMSGLEVLEHVRRTRSPEELPVIMVTAQSQSEEMAEAFDLGANDYVTKPIDMLVLLARIRAQVARQEAGLALRESQERFALAMEGAKDGLWDYKVESGEVFYCPRWLAIMGYGEECTPTLDAWFQRVHPDDLPRVKTALKDHLAARALHFGCEHRVIDPSGSSRWVLVRGSAVRDNTGRAIRVVGSISDITERKIADTLTGLPNRVRLEDRVGELIERARTTSNFSFAVLLIDIDRFKHVNDRFGYMLGDELIVQVARRLEQSVRTSDTVSRISSSAGHGPDWPGHAVARLEGDEFAVLLDGIQHPQLAVRVAERLADAMATPFTLGGQETNISISIGIALSSQGYERAEDVIRDAETALHHAKFRGGGRLEVFEMGLRQEVLARLEMEAALRIAIEQQEFRLWYQPIILLETGRIVGAEALLRWPHASKGMIPPGDFIPVAEDTGLMIPLGYWVLHNVCRQVKAWERVPEMSELVVSVNMSSRHFTEPDFVDRVIAIAGEHKVDPAKIDLELTETSAARNTDEACRVLEQLRGHGFNLSLDDFGTGYSSLSQLQRLPLDRLKIDRSFLAGVDTSVEAEDMVRTIVDLARRLRLQVVAEGIERSLQAERLRGMHCEFGQGFLFGKAVTPDALLDLVRSGPLSFPCQDVSVA
jgi:PAS domain S-box-containing protein